MGSNRAKTLRSYLMYTPLVKLDKVYDHIEVQPYILANLMSTGGIWFFSLGFILLWLQFQFPDALTCLYYCLLKGND